MTVYVPETSPFWFSIWLLRARAYRALGWGRQLRLNRNVCAKEWEGSILDFSLMQASPCFDLFTNDFAQMLSQPSFDYVAAHGPD